MGMKHKITQTLFDYWNAVRAGRPAPRRSEIDPGDIRRLLPYVFILERRAEDSYPFRLAGTGLCNIYGMEFRGHDMLATWADECADTMRNTLNDVIRNASVAMVEYTATTSENSEVAFEMVLMPLAHENGAITRVLGAIVPLEDVSWIGDRLLSRQWIDRVQLKDPELMPKSERPAQITARRILRQRPPLRTVPYGNQMIQRPPLRSERTYLRLIKNGDQESA